MFKPARATLTPHAPVPVAPGADSDMLLQRVLCGVVVVLGMALLITASLLTPDPSGYGTHQQLGLAPCGFLLKTGLPCPTCGMTTSFAWAASGRFDRALMAQPAGLVLSLMTACAVIVGLYGMLSGRRFGPFINDKLVVRGILLITFVIVAGWAYKLLDTILTAH